MNRLMRSEISKTVYICGDSFGCADPEYTVTSWTEILANKLPVINLSRVCASNLQIALQVDQAIADHAGFVIYMATTSTRHDVPWIGLSTKKNLLDRFVDLTCPDDHCDLTSYSTRSLDQTTLFNSQQLSMLQQYHKEFDNLDLSIYLNQNIIEAVLNRLQSSGIDFCFDQGGFEHPKFGGNKKYFSRYDQHRSQINIWDHVVAGEIKHRPYHHINDAQVHQRIADYYYQRIIHDQT